jgi:F0F1-type ATP synthase assembly protein I
MAQITKEQTSLSPAALVAEWDMPDRWRALYRAAGAIALAITALIPIQIAVFMANPFPETAAGWLTLFQERPFVALINTDLLLVAANVGLVVIAAALYVALRRTAPSLMAAATGLWVVALGLFIAANPAIEMLAVSERYAEATTDVQRAATLGAGQALLARWEGTSFQVSYVVGQLAGILIGFAMLRNGRFGRTIPWLMIAGNVIGFAYYVPSVGLMLSAFSGVVLWTWFALLGPKLLRMAREEPS